MCGAQPCSGHEADRFRELHTEAESQKVRSRMHTVTPHSPIFQLCCHRVTQTVGCFAFSRHLFHCFFRIPSEFHSSSYTGSSASPQSSVRVVSPAVIPLNSISSFLTPAEIPRGVTSPPDSEAYYGETDSDADTHSNTYQRRQRRTPPHIRSPARYDNNEEETSEMSG